MASASSSGVKLEIGHVLFIDIVGYSKLLITEQRDQLQTLKEIVRATEQFRIAEADGKLLRLPTGDGGALVFRTSPEAPVLCALEISKELKKHPELRVRMGIHSGPVSEIADLNEQANIAGAGINIAQRVMDCGDAGHILLSKHVADDLEQYPQWRSYLHDLGECEVKHGVRVGIVNLSGDGAGNAAAPKKFQAIKKHRAHVRWAAVAVALIVLAAIVGGTFFFSHRPTTSAVRALDKSIAVLPFKNLSRDPDNAFFTDGVQDEILTDLAKIADLKVISRTSVMQYKSGVARNLRKIGEELGVAHLLEGSVQRAGNRVRVSAQLLDARNDAHLWAEHYDRPLDDVFAIQSEIAKAIADQLRAKLSHSEKAEIERSPTADLAAFDLYARAKTLTLQLSYRGLQAKESFLQAVELLNQAVARDPNFLLAYCQLAYAHDILYLANMDHTPARLALADRAVQTALRLQPDSGEAHLALAQHLYSGYLDYDRARQELAIAQPMLPNSSQVFQLIGFIDRRQDRGDEAARNMEKALEFDPRNLFIFHQISQTYWIMHRYEQMAAVLDRALAAAPKDVPTRTARARIDLEWRADTKPLHSVIESILAEDPAAAPTLANAWVHLALCEHDLAAADRALVALSGNSYTPSTPVFFSPAFVEALIARIRGDTAAAHTAFTKARAQQEQIVRSDPDYAPALCVLGLIDAGLGRKEDALREGRRATELLPVARDTLYGPEMIRYFAVICAWTGEKELALEQLTAVTQIPSFVTYGQLRLYPLWDPLRGDPRFEKIVASLAPKQ